MTLSVVLTKQVAQTLTTVLWRSNFGYKFYKMDDSEKKYGLGSWSNDGLGSALNAAEIATKVNSKLHLLSTPDYYTRVAQPLDAASAFHNKIGTDLHLLDSGVLVQMAQRSKDITQYGTGLVPFFASDYAAAIAKGNVINQNSGALAAISMLTDYASKLNAFRSSPLLDAMQLLNQTRVALLRDANASEIVISSARILGDNSYTIARILEEVPGDDEDKISTRRELISDLNEVTDAVFVKSVETKDYKSVKICAMQSTQVVNLLEVLIKQGEEQLKQGEEQRVRDHSIIQLLSDANKKNKLKELRDWSAWIVTAWKFIEFLKNGK
jgi:hypothetical protein